jgi:uncharacterized protein
MPTLEFQTTINAPLEKVWAFHQDVRTALPMLSPPKHHVTIESADEPPREGARQVLRMRGPLGREMRWVARLVEHRPPHAVVFGEEARFVDVQESGPFKSWRHEHDFEAIDSRTTRLLDRVTYTPPLGPIGNLGDLLLIRWQIKSMFRHRHRVLREHFASREQFTTT